MARGRVFVDVVGKTNDEEAMMRPRDCLGFLIAGAIFFPEPEEKE
jgi:hypothetical protein